MAAIFFVSAQSDPPIPRGVSDKSLHGAAYFGLAVLVLRALAGQWPLRLTATLALMTMAISVAYGATDELHQMFVPGRTADIFDLGADAAGAALGLIACGAWNIIRNPRDV
jgi:VanZ family protein